MNTPDRGQEHASAMLEALTATGPFPEYAGKLMLFGRLVGTWDIDGRHFDGDGNITKEQHGEWIFDWVLEGRAIQDVIVTPPRAERRKTGKPAEEYGTTVRFYDPHIDAWRVTFIAPVFGGVVNLIARSSGDKIVLEGRAPDNRIYRWVFSDITDHAFRWSGYISGDEGRTWLLEEEIVGRRRSPSIQQSP